MFNQNTEVDNSNLNLQEESFAQGSLGSDPPSEVVGSGGERKNPPWIWVLAGTLLFLFLVGGVGSWFLFTKKFTPQEVKEVKLVYWGLEDYTVMQPMIADYQTKTNVKVEYIQQDKQDYRERLTNALARGVAPDIFSFHNTWVPMFSSQFATLSPQVMDPGTYQATFYPSATSDLRRGPDIVGIPLAFDGLGLFVNQDIFDKYGKSPPATWDELRKLAVELTVKDAEGRIEQSGVALGNTQNVDHWQDTLGLMMLQNGADLTNPTDQKAQDSLSFFSVFSKEDKVWDETLPFSTAQFALGKLAMYFGPSWRVAEIKRLNPNLNFKVVRVPQLPRATPSDTDVSWASYWAQGVSIKSKNKQEAWEFLVFISSKEGLLKMSQGVIQSRQVGFPFSRVDMAGFLGEDQFMGSFVRDAQSARSGYLASYTFDGPTGINSRISSFYSDAITSILEGEDPDSLLIPLSEGVKQVLVEYTGSR
ncbi:MAG: extracellular solute-binding protein [Candidatus Blackburnbacteria bacterium]|nr:extracellular solute-binding protein [Candidatus Blackburnbacteria bacterium]